MKTYIIKQKQSGTGSIHDLASDQFDRVIVFPRGTQYAVVNAAYYGGKGYTTHKSAKAASRASVKNKYYSHAVIDANGNRYTGFGDHLMPLNY